MSSLLVPYSRTDVGFKIAFPQRGDSGRVSTKESIHESRLEGESIARRTGLQELLPDEVREIAHRTRSITPALASLDRLQAAIEDQRLSLRAFGTLVAVGIWSRATSLLRFAGSPWFAFSPQRELGSDRVISAQVSEVKRITERIVMPSLAQLREEYRGRSFVRDIDTPAALLLMSVPTEKVGKVCSFDSLRLTIDTRALGARTTCDLSRGEGRIVLERTINGAREQLELAYKRPGKVDVYVNGERRGSMWNDDAITVCDAFLAGRAIPLEKRKRSEHYTVC